MAHRPARVEDVHETALAMPHVTVEHGSARNPVYQVGRRSFVYFRTPRADALDAGTGERLADVILIWVPDEPDKQALVLDTDSPYFSTPHFDGHPSVMVRASRLGEVSSEEIVELVQDAWLSQASVRRGRLWLQSRGLASQPDRAAYPGLTTSSIRASRWSKG